MCAMDQINPELLAILVCPACKTKVVWDSRHHKLVCASSGCGLKYSIRDGIPVMLVDEAEK